MNQFRFNQGSQKVMGGVQRVALRLTCAEKVRRLGSPLSVALSNLLTSSNLAAHPRPRICAHTYARPRMCMCKFRLDRLGG